MKKMKNVCSKIAVFFVFICSIASAQSSPKVLNYEYDLKWLDHIAEELEKMDDKCFAVLEADYKIVISSNNGDADDELYKDFTPISKRVGPLYFNSDKIDLTLHIPEINQITDDIKYALMRYYQRKRR